ncbi:MAG: guanylate kinase [Clostridiales bacterium]|nr:guanylate kinase [Clostridiales bacterium]
MRMSDRGLLLVLSGPSGAGKGTAVRRLLELCDNIVLSISATTRPPREGEGPGHYDFLPQDEFLRRIEAGRMLEHAVYNGQYYGTPAAWVDEQLAAGRHVLLEIEMQGALQIRQRRPEAILMFMAPPSMQALEQRLRGRGTETEQQIQARLAIARGELAGAAQYDYILVNRTVEGAAEQMCAILTAERHRASAMEPFLQALQQERN